MLPRAQKPTAVPPATSRMTLANLVKGRRKSPIRVVLYGVEGVGKSTFAADAPAPIFLGAEDGTAQLDVVRFPSPESWGEVLEAVRTLTQEEHGYQTLVLDTLDWAEPLVWAHVCQKAKVDFIEDVGGGYGKGYTAAVDEWRILLAALGRLREKRGMHVVLLAHSHVKSFKNPEGEDFDRYELKLNQKAAGLMKEWADDVLFAQHETLVAKDSKKRVRGVDTGARVIFTQRRAAYDAKNRHSLPDKLPLSWGDYWAAVEAHQPAEPAQLEEAIRRKAAQLGGQLEERALAALERAAGDATKLAQLNDWANGKLNEKEEN